MPRRGAKKPYIPIDCQACQVRDIGICAPFSGEALGALETFKAAERMYAPGRDFLVQGESADEFFTVLDGWAFLYELLEDGRRQILDFCLPGAFFGFQPDLSAPVTYSAQALTDMSVCVFPRSRVADFVRQHPELGLRMACVAARDQYLAFRHLSNVGRRTARERVASLLLELFFRVRLHSPASSGDKIVIPLTQEHIGDALGLTSVHVNRTLRQLREEKLLTLKGGSLQVLDPDRLAEVAGFESDVAFLRH